MSVAVLATTSKNKQNRRTNSIFCELSHLSPQGTASNVAKVSLFLHARYILNIGKYRFLYFPNLTLIAFIKSPLLNALSSNQACLRQDFQVFTCSGMADAKFFGNQTAADSVPDKVPGELRRKVPPRVLQPEQYSEPVLIGQRPKHAICFHFSPGQFGI